MSSVDVEATPAAQRNAFLADLCLAEDATRAGILSSTQQAADKTWTIWKQFCGDLHLDPLLRGVDDPIAVLQVYAHRVRSGERSRSNKPVKASTVATSLREVGQAMALMGTNDPRLNQHGKLDLRLSRQIRSYERLDPPATRVKPIPIGLLLLATTNTTRESHPTALIHSCADMTIIAFYFLMCPGEYAATAGESHPFRLHDVELYQGARRLDHLHANVDELTRATFVILVFTTQKNAVRGEKIGHGRSGHRHFCPVWAVVRRVQHLRQHGANPATPLHTYYQGTPEARPHSLTTRGLNAYLRRFVATHGRAYGLRGTDVEARSLRSSGAMALLCARVDTDLIRLVGRWRSDAMPRYLHVQTPMIMSPLAGSMYRGGNFAFNPLAPVPHPEV